MDSVFVPIVIFFGLLVLALWIEYFVPKKPSSQLSKRKAAKKLEEDDEFRIDPDSVPEFKSSWRNTR